MFIHLQREPFLREAGSEVDEEEEDSAEDIIDGRGMIKVRRSKVCTV